ncbi:MAG: hypothetical protein IIZ19_03625, partial [Clostridia bacterium]|nr:hypothetical protein [Clostridia bacterium]
VGMIIMALSGVMIYIFAPQMIGIMSPDPRIRALGTQILRIEAFAAQAKWCFRTVVLKKIFC